METISKKLLGVVIIVVFTLFLSSCFRRTYDSETDPHKYLKYELLEDGTYEVTGFTRKIVKEVTIPSLHEGIEVTAVSKGAFQRFNSFMKTLPILKLNIEEGIKKIDDDAFNNAGLLEVILPESLEYLGDEALAYNKCEINYVNNLKYVGVGAFSDTNLKGEIYLKNIEYGRYAFGNTKVSKVSFDDNIKIIPEGLFSNVLNLEEVLLPDNLEVIGDYAFTGTNLKILELKDEVKVGRNAFSDNHNLNELKFLGDNIELGDRSFENNINLNKVDFGKLKNINSDAFRGAPLNKMKLSPLNYHYEIINNGKGILKSDDSTLILGGSEFNDFSKVKIIGYSSFSYRTLGDIVIPSTVLKVENYAFYETTINSLEVNAIKINESAFTYSKIISDELIISSKIIESYSFKFSKGFKVLRITSSDAVINTNAFVNLSDLETIHLSGGVSVFEKAFTYNPKLTSVYYGFDNLVIGDLSVDMFFKHYDSVSANKVRYAVYHEDFKIFIPKSLYEEALLRWNLDPSDEYDKYKNTLVKYIQIVE